MTSTTATPTPAKLDQLRRAYDLVFSGFSASRTEVAEAVGVSNAVASRLLNQLRDARLIDAVDVNDSSQGDRRRGAFKEVEWQCNETYDSIDASQAKYLFDVAFGVTTEPQDESEPQETPSKLNAKDVAELEVEKSRGGPGTPVEVWAPAFAEIIETPTRENSQTMFSHGPWCRLCEVHFTGDRDKHAKAHAKELAAWRSKNHRSAPAANGEQHRASIDEATIARIVTLIQDDELGITTVAKMLSDEQHKTATGKTTWYAATVRTLYLNATGKSHLPSKMKS